MKRSVFFLATSMIFSLSSLAASEFNCFPVKYTDSDRFINRVFNEEGDKLITQTGSDSLTFVRGKKSTVTSLNDIVRVSGIEYCQKFKAESSASSKACQLAHFSYRPSLEACLQECLITLDKEADVSFAKVNDYQYEMNSNVEGKLQEKSVCFEKSAVTKLIEISEPFIQYRTFVQLGSKVYRPVTVAKSNRTYEVINGLKLVSPNGEMKDESLESFAKHLNAKELTLLDMRTLPALKSFEGKKSGKCQGTTLTGAVDFFNLKIEGNDVSIVTKTPGSVNFKGKIALENGAPTLYQVLTNDKLVKRELKSIGDNKVLVNDFFCELE